MTAPLSNDLRVRRDGTKGARIPVIPVTASASENTVEPVEVL